VITAAVDGLSATGSFRLVTGAGTLPAALLAPFPPRADEQWPAATLSSADFVGELRKLREIYTGTFDGMEAKYMLSYFLYVRFGPTTGMRSCGVSSAWTGLPTWPRWLTLAPGERFYLVGEDLNVDPATGARIDPCAVADPAAFLAALSHTAGARRRSADAAGIPLDIVEIGTVRSRSPGRA